MLLTDVYRFPFEWDILEWFYQIGNQFFNYFFYFISEFGSSIIILLVVTIIYWCINKEKGRQIAFICFFTISFNNVLKGFFDAKRPFEYDGKKHLRKLENSSLNDGASGTSFPSGHSQNSSCIYSSLFLNFKNKIIRISSVCLMILIPISRLYLGVHFPGDVVTGVIFGIAATLILSSIFNKFKEQERLIYLILTIMFIPALFIPNIAKDFFKGYGLMLGLLCGYKFEHKYVNFKISSTFKTNILRYMIGIIIIGSLYGIFHMINHLEAIEMHKWSLFISNFLTHGLLAFVAIAIVPILYQKIPFLKDKNYE